MNAKTFSGEKSVQVETELKQFMRLLQLREVSSYLEIGAGRGDTLHEVASSLPKGSLIVAVDMPDSAWGFSGSKEQLDRVIADLIDKGYDAHVIYGNSTDQGVVSTIEQFAQFDCIFIDGDHTREGVANDFNHYAPMGKIVAFHDICDTMKTNKRGETIEVPLFWKDIKENYESAEFIADGSTMGIGVLFL